MSQTRMAIVTAQGGHIHTSGTERQRRSGTDTYRGARATGKMVATGASQSSRFSIGKIGQSAVVVCISCKDSNQDSNQPFASDTVFFTPFSTQFVRLYGVIVFASNAAWLLHCCKSLQMGSSGQQRAPIN